MNAMFERKRRTLENAFFAAKNKELMEQYGKMHTMKETREDLSIATGITNEAILDKFIELDIHPETAASLSLVPLVEVAWADGTIEPEEKIAILKAIDKTTSAKSKELNHKILESWLEQKPDKSLYEAWEFFTKELCSTLSDKEKKTLKKEIIGHAKAVAESCGGFLGIMKISDQEDFIIRKMEKVFE